MTTNEIITVLLVTAAITLMVSVGIADRRRRRRDGSGPRSALSGTISTFDEAFHPAAARAAEVREIQREVFLDAPAPGDPLGLRRDRRIVLRLDRVPSDHGRGDEESQSRSWPSAEGPTAPVGGI
ncbi:MULTISPECIES: hypothetical protein [Microbacterium]|uniref:hypothetical protein n=1 Tax=Microbacterium TaxID=33882 RepID=UPI00278927FD|nr:MULTISPECIES: hypothetical protein [Microbacterium]MDQ1084722.1 hypothetical protein [Microbacterium sp. SORGH_AS_0344]MDQ1170001.1 hypothetical protein [Microbacterium proteolyticum]